MKVTLSRALSMKNRLTGEIERLSSTLKECNSWRKDNEPEYNAAIVLEKLTKAKDKLVEIKTKISAANTPIQRKIFQLSELKDTIKTMRGIVVKKGKQLEGVGRYGHDQVEMEFECKFGRVEIDSSITDLQDNIDSLQAELDKFNSNTEIEISD